MKQQTAMQKLLTNLKSIGISIPKGVEMIYLEIEKQQIMKAYKDYHDLGHIYGLATELYYNENFNLGTEETER